MASRVIRMPGNYATDGKSPSLNLSVCSSTLRLDERLALISPIETTKLPVQKILDGIAKGQA